MALEAEIGSEDKQASFILQRQSTLIWQTSNHSSKWPGHLHKHHSQSSLLVTALPRCLSIKREKCIHFLHSMHNSVHLCYALFSIKARSTKHCTFSSEWNYVSCCFRCLSLSVVSFFRCDWYLLYQVSLKGYLLRLWVVHHTRELQKDPAAYDTT